MYIFFLILLSINLILVIKFEFFKKFVSINDKKTGVALLGGLYFFINFVIINIYFLIDPNNLIIGNYFKEFEIDQNNLSAREVVVFILLPIIFFLIGLFDDKYNLSANYRLTLSFFTIFIFLLIDKNFIIENLRYKNLFNVELYNLAIPFTIICMSGLIFALNMFDGINLQIGLYFLIIFSFFIFKGIFVNFFIIFILITIVFLFFNSRNKIYIGDSGVYFLGALVSLVFLKNYNNQNLSIDEIVILSLIPVIDMFRVIISRLINGVHPFSKDNQHLHYILKINYNNYPLVWNLGSILTLLNIFLLEILDNTFLVLFISLATYIF